AAGRSRRRRARSDGGRAPGRREPGRRSRRGGRRRRNGTPRPAGRCARPRRGARAPRPLFRAPGTAGRRRARAGPRTLHDRAHGGGDARLLRGNAGMHVSSKRLVALVRRFPDVRVLVVGDLMLDQFVWGRVQRISPEAPVPVVQVTTEDVRPGGAGNVVSNIAALGGRAAACGIVGRDGAGARLTKALRALGAAIDGVVVAKNGETTQKTRIIAHHQQVVRLDRDAAAGPDGASARRVRDFVLRQRGRFDVLVVSDYAKGAVEPELLHALADAQARRPFIWVVDPKRAHFAHYRRASLIKPNREEAADAAGMEIRDTASLRAV